MTNKITKKMKLGEVAKKYPEAAMVLMNYGLHCVGCHAANMETVEEGAKIHGMSDKNIAKMIKEMNKEISKK